MPELRALVDPDDVATRPTKAECLLGRATLYGLFLRQNGYAPDEAAWLVASRYPQARGLLNRFLGREEGGAKP